MSDVPLLITRYRQVADAASSLADAARDGDADAWRRAHDRCMESIELASLPAERPIPGTPMHGERVTLLKEILACDADIRRSLYRRYAAIEPLLGASGSGYRT